MNTRQLISFDWALKCLLRSKANTTRSWKASCPSCSKDDIEILESESNRDQAHDKSNRVDKAGWKRQGS